MRLRLVKRKIKFLYQKLVWGFSDDELWSLDNTTARWLLPRLQRFRDITFAHPACLNSLEEWKEILDTIIFALERHLEDEWLFNLSEEDKEKVYNGFEYLGTYFRGLWF
jgi:hypothetical protein